MEVLKLSNNIFTIIRTKYNILSPAQKIVANYILKNSTQAILLSISDLATQCDTSEPTVIRFLKKIDYSSYQVFKVHLAQEISIHTPQAIYENINFKDDILQIKKKILQSTTNSINDLETQLDDETIIQIMEILTKATKILFFGCGGSATIAQDAFHKFLRLGLNVITDTSPHIMCIHCTHTISSDVLLLISHSGESREILDCARLAKKNKATIIALTSYKNSSLTKLADYVLLSSTNETNYHTDAMVSRIVQLVILDMIYVAITLNSGENSIENLNKSKLAVALSKN